MKQALVTMLELQDAMNSKVHKDWRNQQNAWYRAIWVECAELLDHYGWKWWKAQSPDLEQVELELIDIWHFGISISLEGQQIDNYDAIAERLERALKTDRQTEDGEEALRLAVERFACETLQTKLFDATGFAELMQYAGLSFEQLFRSYVAKNVLNIFRQDHGYKEGTYRKLWAGKEDNEHLMSILSDLDQSEITRDRIYDELAARYQESA